MRLHHPRDHGESKSGALGLGGAQQRGEGPLTLFLGPTTVALAVPLYLNLRRIRQLFWPIFTTLVIGGVVATGMGVLLGWWFGADHMILMTMAPKSVTMVRSG